MVEAGADDAGAKPQASTSVQVMEAFEKAHPTQENVDKFYDGMTPEAYDDFLKFVNFCDPPYIA